MFIKKRKYKELINKIEELEKDNRRLTELARIDKKTKKYKTLEEFLKKEDIQFAILEEDYITTKIWNDGRYENGVREICYSQKPGEIPVIEMVK